MTGFPHKAHQGLTQGWSKTDSRLIQDWLKTEFKFLSMLLRIATTIIFYWYFAIKHMLLFFFKKKWSNRLCKATEDSTKKWHVCFRGELSVEKSAAYVIFANIWMKEQTRKYEHERMCTFSFSLLLLLQSISKHSAMANPSDQWPANYLLNYQSQLKKANNIE